MNHCCIAITYTLWLAQVNAQTSWTTVHVFAPHEMADAELLALLSEVESDHVVSDVHRCPAEQCAAAAGSFTTLRAPSDLVLLVELSAQERRVQLRGPADTWSETFSNVSGRSDHWHIVVGEAVRAMTRGSDADAESLEDTVAVDSHADLVAAAPTPDADLQNVGRRIAGVARQTSDHSSPLSLEVGLGLGAQGGFSADRPMLVDLRLTAGLLFEVTRYDQLSLALDVWLPPLNQIGFDVPEGRVSMDLGRAGMLIGYQREFGVVALRVAVGGSIEWIGITGRSGTPTVLSSNELVPVGGFQGSISGSFRVSQDVAFFSDLRVHLDQPLTIRALARDVASWDMVSASVAVGAIAHWDL